MKVRVACAFIVALSFGSIAPAVEPETTRDAGAWFAAVPKQSREAPPPRQSEPFLKEADAGALMATTCIGSVTYFTTQAFPILGADGAATQSLVAVGPSSLIDALSEESSESIAGNAADGYYLTEYGSRKLGLSSKDSPKHLIRRLQVLRVEGAPSNSPSELEENVSINARTPISWLWFKELPEVALIQIESAARLQYSPPVFLFNVRSVKPECKFIGREFAARVGANPSGVVYEIVSLTALRMPPKGSEERRESDSIRPGD